MRDEIDARMWVAHHEAFGRWIDDAAAALRSGFNRLAIWDGTTPHLFALITSFAVTALSFHTTAA